MQEPGNLQVKYGWPLTSSNLKFGLALGLKTLNKRTDYGFMDSTPYKTRSNTYFIDIGLISISKTSNRTGLLVGVKYGKGDYNEFNRKTKTSYTLTTSVTPEKQFNEKSLLRSLFSLAYNKEKFKLAPSGFGITYQEGTSTINDEVGLGWTIKPHQQTLLTFGINISGSRNVYKDKWKNYFSGIETTSRYVNFSQNVIFRIGAERKIISSIFVLRGVVDVARFYYSKNKRTYSDFFGGGGYKSKYLSFSGPVSSYKLGLGIQLTHNLLLDFSLDKINSRFTSDSFKSTYSTDKSSSANFNIGLAATYTF